MNQPKRHCLKGIPFQSEVDLSDTITHLNSKSCVEFIISDHTCMFHGGKFEEMNFNIFSMLFWFNEA